MHSSPSFLLGRQPILDRNQNTVAYELLFRSGSREGADVQDNRMATSSVIAHAFNELGIDAVLGRRCRGFINFDAELLMSGVVELLPADRTVVELLETVDITPEIVARCGELRTAGFHFALDDVVQMNTAHESLLHLIEVVKVDIPATPPADVPGLVTRARRAGVKLLAEKVDSLEQVNWCLDLGFDLFQGFYFARPVILEGRRADPQKQVLMHLLQQTLTDADPAAIERTFKQSPELSYKLMRLVNSVSMGLRSKIQSLSHALVVLGSRQLQRWLQVLLFAHHSSADFPSPLLTLAVTRGKLMELLSERESFDQGYRDRAFMTGILSLMDALFGTPIGEIVAQLNLTDDVRDALLGRTGRLGNLLSLVEALERNDDEAIARCLAGGKPCTLAELPAIQVAAMAWADGIAEPA
ncbi:MAG: EAL domain-containing protein [Gammaproteobacteria bacterium]|nr:EAL domain-containing protein [Gammaproteobacteria bacterium]